MLGNTINERQWEAYGLYGLNVFLTGINHLICNHWTHIIQDIDATLLSI